MNGFKILIGMGLLAVGWFGWPTLFRYDKLAQQDGTQWVRIHRITGRTELLGTDGWVTVGRDEPVSRELDPDSGGPRSIDELAPTVWFYDDGHIEAYFGSDPTIWRSRAARFLAWDPIHIPAQDHILAWDHITAWDHIPARDYIPARDHWDVEQLTLLVSVRDRDGNEVSQRLCRMESDGGLFKSEHAFPVSELANGRILTWSVQEALIASFSTLRRVD